MLILDHILTLIHAQQSSGRVFRQQEGRVHWQQQPSVSLLFFFFFCFKMDNLSRALKDEFWEQRPLVPR